MQPSSCSSSTARSRVASNGSQPAASGPAFTRWISSASVMPDARAMRTCWPHSYSAWQRQPVRRISSSRSRAGSLPDSSLPRTATTSGTGRGGARGWRRCWWRRHVGSSGEQLVGLGVALTGRAGAGCGEGRSGRGPWPAPYDLARNEFHERAKAGTMGAMPRPIWSGAISFGLVSIPVKLYNAVQPQERVVQPARQPGQPAHPLPQGERRDRRRGARRPHRQGLRGHQGPLRHRRPRRAGAVHAHRDPLDRPRRVRRPGRDRPALLRQPLLPRARQGRRSRTPSWRGPWRRPARSASAASSCATRSTWPPCGPSTAASCCPPMVHADEVVDPASIEELEGLDDVEISRQGAEDGRAARGLAGRADSSWSATPTTTACRCWTSWRSAPPARRSRCPSGRPSAPQVVDLMAALEASVKAAKEARGRHPTAHRAPRRSKAAKAAGPRRRQGAGGPQAQVGVTPLADDDRRGRRPPASPCPTSTRCSTRRRGSPRPR